MINGIVKLFYSEIVKTKMKQMPSDEYEIKDEYKKIQDITLRIDTVFLKVLKIMMIAIVSLISFRINLMLGVGIVLTGFLYIIYKNKVEDDVIKHLNQIKCNMDSNLEMIRISKFNEKIKSKLSIMITLLILGIMVDFNIIIIASFIIVFMFTIKDMYSNIK